jgi:hypothetical protein
MFRTKKTWTMGLKMIMIGGLFLAAPPLTFAQIGGPIADATEISAAGQRPLSDALAQLEQLTRMPVNLEDIPYQILQIYWRKISSPRVALTFGR